ncbi:MAG: hypothetical protein ACLP19_05235 [Xanthobacteraceae bacterium]
MNSRFSTRHDAVWNEIATALIALDAEWHEEDHPRRNDGKFGSGSGETERTEPRVVATRKMQEALLRNEWKRSGSDLDFEDIWQTDAGERLWLREVETWNEEHGTSIDPDNTPFSDASTREFLEYFDKKYLAGKKAPFPGVAKANEYFEDRDFAQAVYFKGEEPED